MRFYGGSYERFLFGFEAVRDDGAIALDQVLSIPAHKSAVKCIDTSGSIVVTGGADDQLHLFNMRSNADLGFLVNPAEGPVPCVAFVSTPDSQQPKLLLSGQKALERQAVPTETTQPLHAGSVGGQICVWRAEGFWEHAKAMTGHKDLVSSISPHPSGKLALSVSRDKQMRLWDLTKGSCAYQAALGAAGDLVGFFKEGSTYYVVSSDPSTARGSKISLHSTQGATTGAIEPACKVVSVATHGEHTLVAGCEGGRLMSWDLRKPSQCLFSLDSAHKSRIRGLTAPFQLPASLLEEQADAESAARACIASASSDGVVKLWCMGSLTGGDSAPVPVAEIDVQARFTCLCVFDYRRKKGKKTTQEQVEKSGDGAHVEHGMHGAREAAAGAHVELSTERTAVMKHVKRRDASEENAERDQSRAEPGGHGGVDATGAAAQTEKCKAKDTRNFSGKKQKGRCRQDPGVVVAAAGPQAVADVVRKKRKQDGKKKSRRC